jgi:hypothetical protein
MLFGGGTALQGDEEEAAGGNRKSLGLWVPSTLQEMSQASLF